MQAELDAGVDVMARSKWGLKPLHYAAKVSNLANIRVLLDAGADAKTTNKAWNAPIRWSMLNVNA